jgi:hypothetical protein
MSVLWVVAIVVVCHIHFWGVAAQHQPPSNTITVEFAVNDGTVAGNDTFWSERCLQVPSVATYVMVVMGEVIDYFKPIEGAREKKRCQLVRHAYFSKQTPMVIRWVELGVLCERSS